MRSVFTIAMLSFFAAGLTGCGGESPEADGAKAVTAVSFNASKYLLAEEPDGAVGVIAAREAAEDGQPIVVVGRIGGAANPWIDGRAAFMLIDASKSIVAAGTAGEGELCMDDCCALERAACTTLVKIVDGDGRVLAVDSRQLLGASAGDMLVVRGKVSKDQAGNFAVLADGVHVR